MSDTPPAPKSGGMELIKTVAILVLLPLAFLGLKPAGEIKKNIQNEVQSGTTWQDVWDKVKAGDAKAFQDLTKTSPEITGAAVLKKVMTDDKELRDAIRAAVGRLMKEGKLERGQGTHLILDLDAADKETK